MSSNLPAPVDLLPRGVEVHAAPHPAKSAHILKFMPEGLTLRQILHAVQPDPVLRRHANIIVNHDVLVPEHLWDSVQVGNGDVVTIRVVPKGGKNPLRILLQIALVVAAVYTGGLAAGALGFTAGSLGYAITSAVVSSAVLIGGQALINAIAPLRPPAGHQDDKESPNYFLDQARNRARIFQPIPAVLGKHRMVPPLGASVFTEVDGDEQYLYMIVVWGYGPLELSDLKIGDTPIEQFDIGNTEFEHFSGREGEPGKLYRVYNKNWTFVKETAAKPTLYPSRVDEQALNIHLEWLNKAPQPGPVIRSTNEAADAISIDISFPRGLTEFNKSGNRRKEKAQVFVAYRKVGDTTWLAPPIRAAGGGYAPGAHTSFPIGAVSQGQTSGDDGTASVGAGGSATLFTFEEKETNPVRRGIRWAVSERGQYEVLVQRANEEDGDDEDISTMYWTALRSITHENPIRFRKPIAMTVLKIQATDQIHGTVDELNAVCQLLPLDWDHEASEWVERATSNPAALFRHVLQKDARETQASDAQIDLDMLQEWHDFCRTNGYEYNAIRDFRGSVWDVLSDIAAAGRASPSYIDGKWSVIIDTGTQTVDQQFSPRNSSNFSSQRHFEDVPDAVRVRFANRSEGWQRDERTVYNDGYTAENAEKFITIDAPGITDPDHIYKWARFHLAQIILRPETFSFDTDFECLTISRGSRIKLQHDVLQIGQVSARIIEMTIDDAGKVRSVALDEYVSMSPGNEYGVLIRTPHSDATDPNGRVIPARVRAVAETTETNLLHFDASDVPFPPAYDPSVLGSSGISIGDMLAFGIAAREAFDVLVTRIDKGNDLSARITCIPWQSPGVYNADTEAIPAYDSFLTPLPGALTLTIVEVRSDESALGIEGGELIPQIIVKVKPLDDPAPTIVCQIRLSDSNEPYHNAIVESQDAAQITLRGVDQGETYDLRLRWKPPDGDTRTSLWTEHLRHTVVGKGTNPPPLENMALSIWGDNAVLLRWDPILQADVRVGGEIRFRHSHSATNRNWDNATEIGNPVKGDVNYVILPNKPGVYLARVFDIDENASTVRFVETNAPTLLAYTNVATIMESPTFPGTKTNVSVSSSALVFNTGQDTGTYLFAQDVRLETVQNVRAISILDIVGTANTFAHVEWRTTQDDPNGSPTWTDWRRLDSEQVMARGIQFRLIMSRTAESTDVLRITTLGAVVDRPRISNLLWRGEWVAGRAYQVDNIVFNDDRSWICLRDHTSTEADAPTSDNDGGDNWALLANKGRDVDGVGWELQGPWRAGQEYRLTDTLQDIVAHGGRTYACILTHTSAANNAPGTTGGGTYWELLADRGTDGITWLSETGVPNDSIGKDGDFYLDTNTNIVYKKVSGSWVQQVDLTGADGAQWYTGSTAPPSGLGVNGDYYFRTSDATIWRKGGGSWTQLIDIGTGKWHSDSGEPAGSLGVVGDFYFRTDNGFVYEKTGTTTWTYRRDITGPQGNPGPPSDARRLAFTKFEPTHTNVDEAGDWHMSSGTSTTAWPDSIFRFGAYAPPDSSARNILNRIQSGGTVTIWKDANNWGQYTVGADLAIPDQTRPELRTLTRIASAGAPGFSEGDPVELRMTLEGLSAAEVELDTVRGGGVQASIGVDIGSAYTTVLSITVTGIKSGEFVTIEGIFELAVIGYGTNEWADSRILRGSTPLANSERRAEITGFSSTLNSNAQGQGFVKGSYVAASDGDETFHLQLRRDSGYTSQVLRRHIIVQAMPAATVRAISPIEDRAEYVYRLLASRPSTPPGGTTTPNHVPTGWLDAASIPSATETLTVWVSSRMARYVNNVFSSATAWGTPDVHEAATGSTTTYYQRTSRTKPTTPSGSSTSGWSTSVLTHTSSQVAWQSTRTITYSNGVAQYSWSDPVEVGPPTWTGADPVDITGSNANPARVGGGNWTSLNFSSRVSGETDWSVNVGSITSAGLWTHPNWQASDVGTLYITITATNSRGSVSRTFFIEVLALPVPRWIREPNDITASTNPPARAGTDNWVRLNFSAFVTGETGWRRPSVGSMTNSGDWTHPTWTDSDVGTVSVTITPYNAGGDGPSRTFTIRVLPRL